MGGLVRVLRDAKGKASKDSNLVAAEESAPTSPRSSVVTKLAACRVLTTLIESMFWHEASLVATDIAREARSSARRAAVLRIFLEKHVVFVLFRLLVSQRDGALGSLPEQESYLTLQHSAAELLALMLDASARLLQAAALDEDEHGSSVAPGPCEVQARKLHDSISAMFRECPHLFALLREDSGDCARGSFVPTAQHVERARLGQVASQARSQTTRSPRTRFARSCSICVQAARPRPRRA